METVCNEVNKQIHCQELNHDFLTSFYTLIIAISLNKKTIHKLDLILVSVLRKIAFYFVKLFPYKSLEDDFLGCSLAFYLTKLLQTM